MWSSGGGLELVGMRNDIMSLQAHKSMPSDDVVRAKNYRASLPSPLDPLPLVSPSTEAAKMEEEVHEVKPI
jgi:hypothetical protein